MTKTELKDLIYKINGAIIEVHKNLGAGLLESVYHKCLEKEFELRGIQYSSEFKVPVKYKGLYLETDLRLDFLIEEVLPLEIKAVEHILPIHEAQIISYMKLLQKPKGLLVNFNVKNIFMKGKKPMLMSYFEI